MLRRAFSMCAVLGLISTAQAGVVVTLNPTAAGDYLPGQVVNVEVIARLDAPITGSSGGRLRLAQFDVGASDAALGIAPVTTHIGLDSGVDVTFWDFSSTTNCTNSPELCGDNNFIDGAISADDILNITYLGLTTSSGRQLALTTSDKRVGLLQVTMPAAPSVYLMDVLNPNATGEGGSKFQFGFGTPTDPSVAFSAGSGTVSGGQYRFNVVPEPATLAMLGLGGLAAAFRRRRSA